MTLSTQDAGQTTAREHEGRARLTPGADAARSNLQRARISEVHREQRLRRAVGRRPWLDEGCAVVLPIDQTATGGPAGRRQVSSNSSAMLDKGQCWLLASSGDLSNADRLLVDGQHGYGAGSCAWSAPRSQSLPASTQGACRTYAPTRSSANLATQTLRQVRELHQLLA